MANNTIMTAKNTFGDGLLMDFAPDNTQATCLTHALNATLVTMNGNELSLQNDMGNGRVETAYLPEGYVPVGTCEFGGIIYIVSYNPIINKSQIGCFPSPERNISSDEIQGTKTQFDLSEFVKQSDFGFDEVVSNSIKKVVYQNKLNPGDKFIVHSGNLTDNADILSDFGNKSHILGDFPKQYKVSVVAIEDSGKINYLNNDLKWYNNYYINSESTTNKDKPDLDTYRNILNSGYSVFQSKVSGKLAIMIELERIQGFSSTYEIYNQKVAQALVDDIEYQNYSIYANFNWDTDNPNINPTALVAYDFQWLSNYSGSENKAGKYKYYDSETEQVGEMGKEFLNGNSYIKVPIYKKESIDSDLSTNSYEYFKKYLDYNEIIKNYANVKKVTQQKDDDGVPENYTYWENLHHIIINNNNKQYYDSEGTLLSKDDNTAKIEDFIINNYFKQSISRKLFDISIPYKDKKGDIIDQKDLILSFKIAPMMEYGALVDLAQTHYIDFSKIGSGEINLEGYKYYIGENLCTLQLDSSIYPEENKGVAEIELQFYDNQGLCAIYSINNRVSYSGVITEYIPLNGNTASYRLSSTKSDETLINHAGQVFINSDIPSDVDTTLAYVYLEKEGGKITPKAAMFNEGEFINDKNEKITPSEDNPIFYNDAGTLYSNMLYAVKIIYKYTNKNVLGEYDLTNSNSNKIEWRWLWTNTMFNQHYYNTKDFKDNSFELQLDLSVDYRANYSTNIRKQYQKSDKSTEISVSNLGANIQNLKGNITYKVNLGLQNSWSTFNLYGKQSEGIYKEGVLNIKVYKGNSNITYLDMPSTFDYEYLTPINTRTQNITYPDYSQLLGLNILGDFKDLWSASDNYKLFTDTFNIELQQKSGTEELSYVDYNQNVVTTTAPYQSLTGNNIIEEKKLSLDLWNFSKYLNIYEENWQQVNIVSPLLTPDNATELGFTYDSVNKKFTIDNIYTLCVTRDTGYAPNGKKDGTGDKIQVLIQWKDLNKIPNDLYVYSFGKEGQEHMDWKRDGVIDYKAVGSGGDTSYSQYVNGSIRYFGDGSGSPKSDFGEASFKLPLNQFFLNTLKISDRWHFSKSNNESNTHQELYRENVKITSNDVFYQIGYTDINGIHLFNDYSSVTSNDTINQLISCLTQTYKMGDTVTRNTKSLSDVIQYKHTTIYTQDMIYKVDCNNNDVLLINNTEKLSQYIKDVLNQLETNYLTETDKNVQVQISSIIKNVPIQLNINSIDQNTKDSSSSIELISYNNLQNVQYTQISPNTLYYLENNSLLLSNSQQKVYQIQSIDGSNGTYVAKFGSTQYTTPIASVMQLVDGQLMCKRTSPTGAAYSIVFEGWKGSGSIRDLQYTDRILNDYQFK